MRPRDLSQWVCWRSEERAGKPTKVPYSPGSGRRARSSDPATWGALTEAREAAAREGYDGIGFVFTARDPFCGVDLDSCVDPETGEVEEWAAEIVAELDSYTEFSPSGRGLHVILQAELPPGRPGNRTGKVELYDRDRFFTVTGRRRPDAPRRIENRQEQLSALHASLFPLSEQAGDPVLEPAASENGLGDEEIIRRAMDSGGGQKFAALWMGDRSGYASDSEADLALCSLLAFWVGPDERRIASFFARSGLMRGKWNRQDYRSRTIQKALEGAEFYSPAASTNRDDATVKAETTPAHTPLPEAADFPTGAMPNACQPLIREATAALGCAPELVALPMLAALSSAIGASRVIEVKGGWREGATLFLAVVASPGAMKTPAAKVAKAPVFERQRGLGGEYAEDKEEHRRDLLRWETEKKEAAKRGEVHEEASPSPPAFARCVAGDTTLEALVCVLEDNPRGLLVHKDELTGWVRSMDQYKGGKGSDRQHWLSLWSNDEVVVDRKSRQGEPIVLAKPFVSLFGGIQPAMLTELGGAMEDGLMDRFLFAYPTPRHAWFNEYEISDSSRNRHAALYNELADLTLAQDEHGDPNPKPLKLSPEAKRLFAGVVDSLAAEAFEPGFPARLEGVYSKMRGYLARLSLILAVCRLVESDAGGNAGESKECVEREDVEAAAEMIEYFKAHARRVYAELRAPDDLEVLAADLKALIEASEGRLEATATELHDLLEQAGCEALPERPKELSQSIRKLAERTPALRVRPGHRGKERVLRLELVEDSVGSYGTESYPTDATDATDANSGSYTRPDTPFADATDTEPMNEAVPQGNTKPAPQTNEADEEDTSPVPERESGGRVRFTV